MSVEFNSIRGNNDHILGIPNPLNVEPLLSDWESPLWITGVKSLDVLFGVEFSLENMTSSLPFSMNVNTEVGIGLGSEESYDLYIDYWGGGAPLEINEGPGELNLKGIYRFGIEALYPIQDGKHVGIGYKFENYRFGPDHDFQLSPNILEVFIRFR